MGAVVKRNILNNLSVVEKLTLKVNEETKESNNEEEEIGMH